MDETPQTPEEIAIVPALSYNYDENDDRVNAILDEVAEFCGHEFTVVPPNPDEEPGVPVAQAEEGAQPGDPDFEIDSDDPDKTGQIDPDKPGEPYPEQTDELDKLREAYNTAKAKNLEEKQSYWALLWQVIRLLSDATCWTDSFDDTFIYQHRSQTEQIIQKPRCCKFGNNKCANWTKIKLLYAPLDDICIKADNDDNPMERLHNSKPFMGGEFHYFNSDGEYTSVPISAKYLNKHYNMHTQQVTIMGADFPDILTFAPCACPEAVDVVLYYNAGYCTIPKALLPLVCQLIAKIEESKVSINECASAMTQVSGLLKSKKVGNIQYAWSDKDTEQSKTQALFTQIYNLANVAELFAISRCAIANQPIAGEVV